MSVVPLALYGASSLLINSTIWIFGGNSIPLSNGSYTLDVSQPWPTSSPLFDSILSKGATLLPLDLPSVYSRYFSTITLGADKSSFWIHGGVSDAVDLTDAKQFAVYSIPDNLWSAAKGTNPPAVFAHSVVSDSKGVAYYYGGSSDVTNTDFSSISNGPGLVKMDTRSSNYSVINATSGNPGVLAWHTATLVNDTLMYVIGGLQPAPSADFPVTVYNTVTNSWGPPIKSAVNPSKRYGHTAVLSADNSQIIVFGGTPDSTTFLNDVWTLNLATNQWTQRNTTGTAPSGRAYHNSVMFKTEMIVMFGSAPNATNTVYILDTNTWKWITKFDPNPPQPTTAVSSGGISTSTSAPSPPPFTNTPISIAGIAGIVLAAIVVLSVVMISVVQPRNRVKPTI